MSPLRAFRNLRIRHKLMLSYGLFILAASLAGIFMYFTLRGMVQRHIESQLKTSTAAMLDLVRTSVSVSIKNHLRAAAERNLEIVQHLYGLYLDGEITEDEARNRAERILLSQTIGTTGYIACVNSVGTMVIHPEPFYVGADISRQAFVQEMITKKEGYIEYDWKNPGDAEARPKALYMTYFEPWDWIIDVSAYRKEFLTLVNVADFQEAILSMHFGKTGYSFVVDGQGNIIIHPYLQGANIFRNKELPEEPLRSMVSRKSGKLVYEWKNPGERVSRQKLVLFNHIPEYDWIVASSSYIDEFYAPLQNVGNVIVLSVIALVLMVFPVSFFIGTSITDPLHQLVNRLGKGAEGDLAMRSNRESRDEVDDLAMYFDAYMKRLDVYHRSLEAEIAERKEAEEALRISEELYRSVMEAAPDPIVVYDMEGRVTYINRAFTDVFGWTSEACLGRKMDHFVPPENWKETRQGLRAIAAGEGLSSVETRRYTKSGEVLDVSIRGAVYRDRNGAPAGSVIIHRDVTDLKRLEKEVMDIGDMERQRIGQDLHDDLCPHLIGIEGLTKVLKARIESALPAEARMAAQIAALIKEATLKTRQLARGLCPVFLVDSGLESSLRELAMKTRSIFGVNCRFEADASVRFRDSIVATHLYRIAQEAVHNAVRHSDADEIVIRISGFGDRVSLRIEDDGVGMPESPSNRGMGLRIMGFRAKMIDGVLDIRSEAGKGTQVWVDLTAAHVEGDSHPENDRLLVPRKTDIAGLGA